MAAHDQCPHQSRLHTARITKGNTETRVHTLQGFACRSHVASSIDMAEANFRSSVT